MNMDENIIDESKVPSKDAEECVDPAMIGQSIVVRREVVSVRAVQQTEKYRDEDEANESKYETENGLRNFALPCATY